MVSADSADEGRSARNWEVCGQRNNRRGHHEQPPLARTGASTVARFTGAPQHIFPWDVENPRLRSDQPVTLAEQLHPPVAILALGVLDVGLQSKRVLQALLGEPKRRM